MRNINEYISTSLEEVDETLIEQKSEELCRVIQENTIDEGVLGSILGGLTGLVAGSSIMKSVCRTLGITQGPLYNLLTSKLVCAAAGAAIGKSI